jgi:hypothetical protein
VQGELYFIWVTCTGSYSSLMRKTSMEGIVTMRSGMV